MKRFAIIAACLLLLAGCKHKSTEHQPLQTVDYGQVAIPDFDADSAFAFVEAQLAFGNRIPGSKAWQQCGDYLV